MKSEKLSLASPDFINPDVSFDLTISVLGGVTGVQLLEEHCKEIENFGI